MNNPLQILYLEDNPRDAELVQDKLRQAGMAHELCLAIDRAEYEAALAQTRFDLILSDYRLPDYDGMAALALARAKQPEVPFILISGTLGEEQAVECMLRGATDYVLKQRLNRLLPAVLRALTEAEEHQRRRQAEESLRESEEQFRAIFETASVGIAQASPRTGIFLRVNEKYCAITGYSTSELLGMSVPDITYPDDRQRDWEAFQSVVRGESSDYHLEKRYLRKDGATPWVNVNMTVLRDITGQPVSTVAVIEDISERKQAEAALQESETRYRRLHENMRDAFASVDLEGRIKEFNDVYCQMLGYEKEEIPSLTYTDVTPEKWHAYEDEIVRAQVLTNGFSEVYEKEYRRKDGTIFPVELRSILLRDASGQPSGMWAIIRDITERKRAEAAMRESEEEFRLLFESNRDALMLMAPPTYKFTRANHAALAMFKVPTEAQFTMLGPWDLSPERQPGGRLSVELANEMNEIALREGSHLFVWMHHRLDGKAFPAEVLLNRFVMKGQVFLQATVRDITLRMRAAEEKERLEEQFRQSQKMESVGRLAGGVAHDFNNMLSIIMGYSELALKGLQASDSLYKDIQEIRNAGQRSADLTRQLLAFARKQTIAPRILDINDSIAGMLKMLGRLIGEDIELLWKPATNLRPVLMDPAQLDQILANLAVNARDAISGVGQMTIETSNAQFDEAYCQANIDSVPGHYVLLAVSDNGCGMDNETRAQIFEPFFTTKPQGQGTGLGLATVYGIVKQNNGFITVHSKPGHGTTFKIHLPRHETEAMPSDVASESSKAPKGSETVLLVEDEKALLKLTRKMLKQLGYTVLSADSPIKALQLTEEYPGIIHLLITDVVMPSMSGRDLQLRLCALRPSIKCLFVSGYTTDVIAHQGILDEGVQFLQKPFAIKTLATKVRETLELNP